jgi:hypothetical protein
MSASTNSPNPFEEDVKRVLNRLERERRARMELASGIPYTQTDVTTLSLTPEEFAERWEVESKIAKSWLEAFVFAGFAVRLEDGRYAATPRALRLSLVPNIDEGQK